MSTVTMTLLFEDGLSTQLSARKGQTVVEAALESGLTLLTDCSNGQCGTCVAQCVAGQVEPGDYDPLVLSEDECDDGARLCCVARLESDAVLALPYDSSEASAIEAPPQLGHITALEQVAAETLRIEVQVSSGVDFLPGQYVRMRPSGATDWRSYSMANKVGDHQLIFYVRLVSEGWFSTWLLEQAQPGDTLEISAPRGSFFLREESRPRLFVAGGTGLAPFLAMLKNLETMDEAQRLAPIDLLVGVRSREHLFALDELESLRQRIPSLTVSLAAEQNAPEGCHTGYATELIEKMSLAKNTKVYVCGPPPMVNAARAAAIKAGIRKSEILCERFT